MVSLIDALSVLAPDAIPLRDYELADDGTGPRIAAWNLPEPQPTAEQIAAVTVEQVAAVRRAKQIAAAAAETLGGWQPTGISDRTILRYVLTLVNDLREHVGLTRVPESEHVAALVAAVQAGYGEPIETGGGGSQ